ncbi:FkbM family methyltransferase [Alphaproteobacteria bacterium GH1-50]|uniref:FkbM family methyltransferase n=1 Tax=Kangsaoukella pontilimi TaxID=2691042 RepID=A0A7C9IS24_9RHOB|nr:FkbM family methyltransferase [Kangsaoukella pontilimi]MXQ08206.1 FkbM family methyltransferase [Kangsaoukella pontilimi]
MQLDYEEELELYGARIPFVREIITRRIERQIRLGNYEAGECQAAAKFVKAGDRVLELGGGIGLVSSLVGKIEGVEKIVSVEAHPGLLDVIRETQRLNGVSDAELRHGVVADGTGESTVFYLRNDFWGSSMEPDSRPYTEAVSVPCFGLDDLIAEVKPSVIISDIEGGELGLFNHSSLEGVRTVIIETHPRLYGRQGEKDVLKSFIDLGFVVDQDHLPGTVWVLHRPELSGLEAPKVRLTSAEHDKADPEVTIVTCMRNEAPFILEWIAYHRSIGIQNFIVFTNDCDDGTDVLLDRLDEMGIVTHLPNPAGVADSTYFQPLALKYSQEMPLVRRSDYVMCIDVDEFVVIRTGEGRFTDLLDAAGPFHALSMSELNFSSGGHWKFEDGWITEDFREHETPAPGHWQARRGVKTIVKGMSNVAALQAHRPFLHQGTEDDFVWLDGSGRPLSKDFTYANPQNGLDRRGGYELVCLNHYALRSVESYLVKQDRGCVVTQGDRYNNHYYRVRSIGGQNAGWIDENLPRARAEWQTLWEDAKLAEIHRSSVRWHKNRVKEISETAHIQQLSEWIRENYFKPE